MTKTSKNALYSSVSELGFTKPFVKRILPSWWDDSLLSTATGVMQFCMILKNRLGLSFNFSDDGDIDITQEQKAVSFKKRSNTSYDKLNSSSMVSVGIAKTVANILICNGINPISPEELSQKLMSMEEQSLQNILSLLWDKGFPVLFVDNLPKSMSRPAGVVIKDRNYFLILLSHKQKSPAAQLFVLLHELGHIVKGHLNEQDLFFDVNMAELDKSLNDEVDQQELEADEFALKHIRKGYDIQDFFKSLSIRPSSASLSASALKFSEKTGILSSHLALSYGKETNDWSTAYKSLNFLENRVVAKDLVVEAFFNAFSQLEVKDDEFDFLKEMQGL